MVPALLPAEPRLRHSGLGFRHFAAKASDAGDSGDATKAADESESKATLPDSAAAKESDEAQADEDRTAGDGAADESLRDAAGDAKEEAAATASSTPEDEEFTSQRPLDLPPAPWRQAGEWVDLEFERAGIPSDAAGLASRWGSPEHDAPETNVLWPHSALNEHRSRPFAMPTGGGKDGDEASEKQLGKNRERLEALWKMSSSHGISWDELDAAYVVFAKTGKQRFDAWSRRPDENSLPKAAKMKRRAHERAVQYLKRFCPEGQDPSQVWPSKTRRLASRIFVEEKKKFLAPWGPGRLSLKLQQLVAARMLRRETQERVHGLRS